MTSYPEIMVALSGVCWTVAYCCYIRLAYRDETLTLPLPNLLLNLTWELLYGVFLPAPFLNRVVLLSWLGIDSVLLHCAWRFERARYPELVQQHFAALLFTGALLALGANALFPYYFADAIEPAIAHGMLLQVLLSWSCLFALISSCSSKGHSYTLWLARFLGSLLAGSTVFIFHPDFPVYYCSPLGWVLFWLFLTGDALYPMVLAFVRRHEQGRGKKTPVRSKPEQRGTLRSLADVCSMCQPWYDTTA